jgi:glutamate synthase (NADPH) small chain
MKTKESLNSEAVEVLKNLDGKALTPRDRLGLPCQEMPEQVPADRAHNFSEVALGYGEAQARVEALRCLQCKTAPCVSGCPVRVPIPEFIKLIVDGDYAAAARSIKTVNMLPAICGRVCPQETQCQAPCTLGKSLHSIDKAVSIGRLERFAADFERENGLSTTPTVKPETGKKVAIIGSGPASITCAADVRREGHEVTMFEAFHKPGGVMVYGIPEFRLPKAIVKREIDALAQMGVLIDTNVLVGRTVTLAGLFGELGFNAAFIGSGAGLPKFAGIPGENLVGVFSANEYLTRANLMKAWDHDHAETPIYPSKIVMVIGGGNVAMDSARMALRLGAQEVHIVYRRTGAEMPARAEEVEHAKAEGIIFDFLQAPTRVLGTGTVNGLEVQRCELGEPDGSGRRSPVPVPGSERPLPCDTVIVALGNESNPLLKQATPELAVDKRGRIIVDENGMTSMPAVYAGGDIVLGSATVILAMGEGRRAANAINALLAGAS